MKGGVGKTTLCVNLAFTFFSQGKKVCVVDNDPQFNATSALVKPTKYIAECIKGSRQTIYNLYEKPPRIGGAQRRKQAPHNLFLETWKLENDSKITLDVIPSRIELYETLRNPSQKEYLLDKFLKKNAGAYDYIFIDCPPTPSVLTYAAFAASDFVLIPVTPDYFSSVGLPQFLATLADFKEDLHDEHNVQPVGVIFTNVPRNPSADTENSMNQVVETLAEQKAKIPVFKSKLSHFTVFGKSLWQSVPVQEIQGKGTRGKSQAIAELSVIAKELEEKIMAAKPRKTNVKT
jgi:chromosome partitioning protein